MGLILRRECYILATVTQRLQGVLQRSHLCPKLLLLMKWAVSAVATDSWEMYMRESGKEAKYLEALAELGECCR